MSKRLTIEEFIKTLKGSGSGSGDVLVVNVVEDNNSERLDKTWQEIYDATGQVVILSGAPTGEHEWSAGVTAGYNTSDGYYVATSVGLYYTANTEDGYPVNA